MIRIERTHTFSIPVSKAFAYITDTSNWGAYWPDFVRIHDPAQAKWSQPGDTVTIVLRLLNRERDLKMRLEKFQKDVVVTYVSRQQGLPDVWHERHFNPTQDGFEYRLVVAYEPRKGLSGIFDRILLKRAVAKALHKTMENLDRVFKQSKVHGSTFS
jgi:hypothetical protein